MKRAITAIAAAALFVGCQESEPTKPAAVNPTPPTKTADAAKTATASETAKPANTAKPPTAKEYYEVSKNGKMYVFGKVDSMLAFRSAGTLPVGTIEKPGPSGEPVTFEAGEGMEAGLMADYAKAHPKK